MQLEKVQNVTMHYLILYDRLNGITNMIYVPEKQIVKWVVVVNEKYDGKVVQYGLDTEFDSTICYCV